MKLGPIVTAMVALGALGGGGYVFLSSSVPYVNVEEAMQEPGRSVHVAGDILHETAQTKVSEGYFEFDLRDDTGKVMRVRHKGPKPANFDSAPKVSVSGQFDHEIFMAEKILVKCPSKYESEKTAGAKA
jgi:cytochrome c-type biogenesis protein CcmE